MNKHKEALQKIADFKPTLKGIFIDDLIDEINSLKNIAAEALKEGLKPCPNHPDVLTSQCGICNGAFPKLEQPKTEEVERGYFLTKEEYAQPISDTVEKGDKISKLTFDKEISQWVDIYSYELGLMKGKEEGYKANNSLVDLENYIESELTDWSDRAASETLTSDYNRARIHSCQDILKHIQELKTKQ